MFNVGSVVSGKYFLDRKKHLKILNEYIDNNQSFSLKAPRRFGKTSLIEQLFSKLNHKKTNTIVCDVQQYPAIEFMTESISNQFFSHFGISDFVQKSKKMVTELIDEIESIKLSYQDVKSSIKFLAQKDDSIQKLCNQLNEFEKINLKANKRLVLFWDEFQSITKYDENILDILRATLQRHKTITYIFAGSVEHLMVDIFQKQSSSFYKFGIVLDLDVFDKDDLMADVIGLFAEKNISFENKPDFENLLLRLNCHPYNCAIVLQKIYYLLLEENRKIITKQDLITAYSLGFDATKRLIEIELERAKTVKGAYQLIYDMAHNIDDNLSPNIRYIRKVELENMGLIIKKDKGKYQIIDSFIVDYLQGLNR